MLLAAGCGSNAVPGLPASQAPLPTAQVRVGQVRLVAELARTPGEREAGLRGRRVAAGRGMAFLYAPASVVRFTMAGVTQPLVGVFAAGGSVVSVEQMAPCAGTVDSCPLYGPPTPVDVVVEAAPVTLAGVVPGAPVVVPVGR